MKALLAAAALTASLDAAAQGYQLQQFEPSAPGDTLLTVSSPWYGKTGSLGVALTTDYGHQPLLGGFVTPEGEFRGRAIIDHQLVGHLDLAAGLFGRVQLSASLPMTLVEAGTPGFGVSPVPSPILGDPRVGAAVRLWGEERSPLIVSLAGAAWIPVGVARAHSGDDGLRGVLRANAGGLVGEQLRWVADVGVLLRPDASLNTVRVGPGMAGNALRFGAGASYALEAIPLALGPEVVAMTLLAPGKTFTAGNSSLELTVAARYLITSRLEATLGVGTGLVRSAGTPDLRVIGRVAWVLPEGFEARPPHAPQRLAEEPPPPAPEQVAAVGPAPEPEQPVAEPAPEQVVAEAHPEPKVAEADPEPTEAEAHPEPTEVVVASAAPAPEPEVALAVAKVPDRAPEFRPEALPHLLFEKESAALTEATIRTLEEIAQKLIAAPPGIYVVEGHSDHLGPVGYNDFLSLMRAEAVQQFLLGQGVPADRLTARGRGSTDPVTDDRSAEGRALNRRVEFTVSGRD